MQSAVLKTHYGVDGLRTHVEESTSFMSMAAGAGLGGAAGGLGVFMLCNAKCPGGVKGAGILGGALNMLNPLTLLSSKDEKEEKDASDEPDPDKKLFKQVNYIEKEICNMNCKVAALMGAAAGAAAGGMLAKSRGGGGSPMPGGGMMAGPLDEANTVPFFVLTKQLEDMQSQVNDAVDRVRSLQSSPVSKDCLGSESTQDFI
ncbi:unnamed protein product [Durusdinium trenchii]|uniref:Mitochondrial import inner membrane translocase subunit TIM22 n=2 Tax=Durusdinium trenchii TaxID=1381693 RepID=A0ABP0KLZ9_9DINO